MSAKLPSLKASCVLLRAVFYPELGMAKNKSLLSPLGPQAWHYPHILLIRAFRALESTLLLVSILQQLEWGLTHFFPVTGQGHPHIFVDSQLLAAPVPGKRDVSAPQGASHQLAEKSRHG